MKSTIIFVYNAQSGLFNTLTDIAHKVFSPETYACHLCALTHSNFGMRKEWKEFIESLGRPVEFWHADELKARDGIEGVSLPAILKKEDGKLTVWMESETINSCQTVDELERLILQRLSMEPEAVPGNHALPTPS